MRLSAALVLCLSGVTATAFSAPGAKPRCSTAECHATVAKQAYLHGPIGVGDCAACHSPHEGKGTPTQLRAKGAALCYRCHEPYPTTSRHSALDKGCTHCHAPHGGSRAHFLRAEAESLCRSCHASAGKANRHVSSAKEPCLGCHDPHGSRHLRLLKRSQKVGQGCPRPPVRAATR